MALDGKLVSSKIREELKEEISTFKKTPKVIDIQIGYNAASEVYIKSKEKACNNVGIDFECVRFTEGTSEEDILEKIEELNNDERINAILLQAPIPSKYDSKRLVNSVNSNKDIDGLTSVNFGKLVNNEDAFIPCTPLGIIKLLEYYNIDVEGKNVVVIGRSNLVGRPIASLMLRRNATVTVCHSKTKNLETFTKNADILISAVGIKHLITKDMVKVGSIVIDVGITREDDKLYGDVDFENVKDIVSFITPVPGGVGPMTVAMFLSNIVKSYKNQQL